MNVGTKGTKGTKRYKYPTVPTGKKVQIGTTPFRGVPFVPIPKQAPDTNGTYLGENTLGQASKIVPDRSFP